MISRDSLFAEVAFKFVSLWSLRSAVYRKHAVFLNVGAKLKSSTLSCVRIQNSVWWLTPGPSSSPRAQFLIE